MYRAARALVIKSSDDICEVLHREPLITINDYGVRTEVVHAGNAPDFSQIEALPDIIILDVKDDANLSLMMNYSKELKENALTKILPVAMFGSSSDFSKFQVNLHLDSRLPTHIISRKLKYEIRVAAMGHEFSRRVETARQFDLNPRPLENRKSARAVRLLVVGKSERYFQLASLFEGDASLKLAATFDEAKTLLQDQAYDCLIVDTAIYNDFDIDLLKDLKLDTRFFSLPVVVLKEGLEPQQQEEFSETGICDLFDLDDATPDLVMHIKTLIQAEHLRRRLVSALNGEDFDSIRDQTTGLPHAEFFKAHLSKLAAQSKAWHTPIAFGVLNVGPALQTNINSDDARAVSLFSQAGQIISNLARVEDLATHLGNGRFVVAAPNSTAVAIGVLMERIGAVLRMTEFSAGGEIGRMKVTMHHHESTAGDTVEEMMQRLTVG